MKQMTTLYILLALALILSSCKGGSGTQSSITTNFRTGTAGLVIESVPNLPPKEIFEGSPFLAAFKLHNQGAYEARKITLKLQGLDDPDFFSVENPIRDLESLDGKGLGNPQGEYIIAEFKVQNKRIPLAANTFSSKYSLTAEYDYESAAQTNFCVNTYLYSDLTLTPQSCKSPASLSLGTQGGPVAITTIEPIVSPAEGAAQFLLKIKIANSGSGKVVGAVRLREVSIANKRLSCQENYLELGKPNQDTFYCSIIEPIDVSYLTTLSASITYRYSTTTQGDLTIKRLPNR